MSAIVVPKSDVPAVQQPNALSPLVQAAMTGGLDTEKLKELLSIQKEYEGNEARKAYHKAVSDFKANAPTIVKDKTVSYGNTNYKHASLGYALTEINPALSQFGLSLSWKTAQKDGIITVTCYLTHSLGHSESTELYGEPDGSGQKNKIQQVASTVTYLKRHTAFALLGLESIEDVDGQAQMGQQDTVSEEEIANLDALITEIGADKAQFLKVLKVEKLSDLPADKYKGAVARLEAKRKGL